VTLKKSIEKDKNIDYKKLSEDDMAEKFVNDTNKKNSKYTMSIKGMFTRYAFISHPTIQVNYGFMKNINLAYTKDKLIYYADKQDINNPVLRKKLDVLQKDIGKNIIIKDEKNITFGRV